jgi:hypothetical protein
MQATTPSKENSHTYPITWSTIWGKSETVDAPLSETQQSHFTYDQQDEKKGILGFRKRQAADVFQEKHTTKMTFSSTGDRFGTGHLTERAEFNKDGSITLVKDDQSYVSEPSDSVLKRAFYADRDSSSSGSSWEQHVEEWKNRPISDVMNTYEVVEEEGFKLHG